MLQCIQPLLQAQSMHISRLETEIEFNQQKVCALKLYSEQTE